MLQIPVTTNGNSYFDISLDGVIYTFLYNYNTRNQRLYLTILERGVPIITGLRLLEYGAPLMNYDLPAFAQGQLVIAQLRNTDQKATLGNIGISQDYSLLFLTDEEVLQIQEEINDIVAQV